MKKPSKTQASKTRMEKQLTKLQREMRDARPVDPGAKRPNPELLRVASDAEQPAKALDGFARVLDDTAWDLPCSQNVILHPHSPGVVRTSLHFALPLGTVGLIVGRHSAIQERGLYVPALLLEAGYRGEVVIPVRNLSEFVVTVKRGERIAQVIVLPAMTPQVFMSTLDDLPKDGERGEKVNWSKR